MIRPEIAIKVVMSPNELFNEIEKGKEKAMNRAGAIVRGIMRRMFRFRKNRKRHSTPPKPPFTHVSSKEFGLKWVRFDYDAASQNVIVGPQGKAGPHAVPGLLNDGGRVNIRLPRTSVKGAGDYIDVSARMRPRPFVQPSLDIYKDKYPDAYRDAVRGGR